MNLVRSFVVGLGLCAAEGLAHANATSEQVVKFDVPPQPLSSALNVFAQQSNLRMIFYTDVTDGMRSPSLQGSLTPEGALKILLSSAALKYEFFDDKTVSIWSPAESAVRGEARLAGAGAAGGSGGPADSGDAANRPAGAGEAARSSSDSGARESAGGPPSEAARGIPEVLVRGSKVLNMDVARSRDDAQPYVIFGREAIEKSGAATLDEFLKQRLTMNSQGSSGRQTGGNGGNTSQINLRGLGANQTLILVDGHRISGVTQFGSPLQPDINGIPLGAIERIEVLPTTASGIYGGSATGGVVNIVLRRDYSGVETDLTYGNAFNGDSATRRASVSAGLSLEGGKTKILLAGSWQDDGDLLTEDRDFLRRAREATIANNGSYDGLTSSNNPPLGVTTNIRSSTGVNLRLKPALGGTDLGSPITYVPAGYTGFATGGTAPLVANAGLYNIDLAPTTQGGGALQPLLREPTVKSVMLTARREFSSRWQAFIDASASKNSSIDRASAASTTFTVAANAANNPFVQALRVTVPIEVTREVAVEVDNRRLVGGVIANLPGNWMAELDHTWNKVAYENTATPVTVRDTAGTAITNGTLNVLRDVSVFPLDLSSYLEPRADSVIPEVGYALQDTVLRAAGPVITMPAGSLNLSAAIERRTETLDPFVQTLYNGATVTDRLIPEREQTVNSAYLELQVPLYTGLDLQLAARHDKYTTEGAANNVTTTAQNESSSTDPTFGLRYEPVAGLIFRSSYGTGFLPPNVSQLVANAPRQVTGATGLVDPRRNNQAVTTYTSFSGGNQDLRPEQSKSWSLGTVLEPRFVRGLRVSVDYTHIKKEDNITSFVQQQQLINNEAFFPDIVLRGTPGPGETVGPITGLDFRLINISKAEIEAYDTQIDYRLETGSLGTFDAFALGTWQTHYKTQFAPDSLLIENVGYTSSSPLKFKANFGLSWSRGAWSAGWAGRYFDSYFIINPAIASATNAAIIASQGNGGRVTSQSYHDLYGAFRLDSGAFDLLSSAEVRVGVQNVFDKLPPIEAGPGRGYSQYADPRLRSYYVTLKMAF